MNVNELITTAINHPEKRASAGRLRLSGHTLWSKIDPLREGQKAEFLPILSHMGSYLVQWPFSSWSTIGLTTRSHNMLRDARAQIRKAWCWDMDNDHGSPKAEYINKDRIKVEYPDEDIPVNPVPIIRWYRDHVDVRHLSVKTPNEAAIKMLLLGTHPEKEGLGIRHWIPELLVEADANDDKRAEVEKLLPANHVNPAFEQVLRSLAYGAIRRENELKVMANSLGLMKSTLDKQASDMVQEMQVQAERHFAPASVESAGTFHTDHDNLSSMMAAFNETAGLIDSASEVFNNVLTAPASNLPRTSARTDGVWSLNWEERVGDIKNSRYQSKDLTCTSPIFSHEYPVLKLPITRGLSVVDVNPRSFSYYWLRRNFHTYRQVISNLGVHLELPLGQSPTEWNYEELALPHFVKSDQ